jgi:hypothetical protein
MIISIKATEKILRETKSPHHKRLAELIEELTQAQRGNVAQETEAWDRIEEFIEREIHNGGGLVYPD